MGRVGFIGGRFTRAPTGPPIGPVSSAIREGTCNTQCNLWELSMDMILSLTRPHVTPRNPKSWFAQSGQLNYIMKVLPLLGHLSPSPTRTPSPSRTGMSNAILLSSRIP